jgi:predicted ATPase
LGCFVITEPARAVLAEQRAVDGHGNCDRNPQLFWDLMLARSLRDVVEHAGTERPVFFDRGLPDLIGYAGLFGLDPSPAKVAATRHRYHDVVFVLPAWGEESGVRERED